MRRCGGCAQQFKARGTLEPQTHRCGRKTLLAPERRARLQERIAQEPDATLAELGAAQDRPFGASTVDGWLRRLGLSRKKTLHAAEQDRPDVAEQRSRRPGELAALPVDRLVFVDESGANTKLTRLHGRAPVGERLVARIPHGHCQTSTLIAGVRTSGPCAPWVFEGAIDGEMFLAWLREGLVPTLRPGDVVILDNLATHKVAGVRETLATAGARLLYLPPYSPDFNPSKTSGARSRATCAASLPRTADELLLAVATAFAAVTPSHCHAFFSHPGIATCFQETL